MNKERRKWTIRILVGFNAFLLLYLYILSDIEVKEFPLIIYSGLIILGGVVLFILAGKQIANTFTGSNKTERDSNNSNTKNTVFGWAIASLLFLLFGYILKYLFG